MIKLDADKKQLVIDLQYQAGRNLADMVVEAIFLYVATESQDKAVVAQLGRMIKGDEPMANVDLIEYTKKETLC